MLPTEDDTFRYYHPPYTYVGAALCCPLSVGCATSHKLAQLEQKNYFSEGVTLLCISLFLYDSGCNGTFPPLRPFGPALPQGRAEAI